MERRRGCGVNSNSSILLTCFKESQIGDESEYSAASGITVPVEPTSTPSSLGATVEASVEATSTTSSVRASLMARYSIIQKKKWLDIQTCSHVSLEK